MRDNRKGDSGTVLRCLATTLAATCLFTAAASANPCLTQAQRKAFEVGALQSQMMVAALSCQAQDGYNATMRRFRTEFAALQKTVEGWFRANFGADWRARHDSYVTDLANDLGKAQSLIPGLYSVPCRNSVALFAELSTIRRASDLAHFAARRAIALPIDAKECTAASPTG